MSEVVCALLQIFEILIIVRIVLSWFPVTSGGALATAQDVVMRMTEWALGPLRRVLPPVRLGAMALDLSPIVVLLLLALVQGAIC